jgi:hypothetical protein
MEDWDIERERRWRQLYDMSAPEVMEDTFQHTVSFGYT